MLQTVEPIVELHCPCCGRLLRLPGGPRRAVRCPSCACALDTPAPADAGESAASSGVPPWVVGVLLAAAACVPLGIPLVSRGGGASLGLAAGLALLGGVLAFLPRPRPGIRVLAILVAAGIGYGVAIAQLRSDEGEGRFEDPLPLAQRWSAQIPAPDEPKPVGKKLLMLPAGNIDPLLAAAFDPAHGVAFVARRDGTLQLYAYPALRCRLQEYGLGQPAYRVAVDTRHGRVFAAVSSPKDLHLGRFGDPPAGRGEIHVYDFRRQLEAARAQLLGLAVGAQGYLTPGTGAPALVQGLVPLGMANEDAGLGRAQGATAAGSLRPAARVPLDLPVSHLLYSEAHDCVYYLATGPQGAVLGRVSAADPSASRQVSLPGARCLCLSPGGRHLYAAGDQAIWELDPTSEKTVHQHVVEGVVTDMGVDDSGKLMLVDRAKFPSVTILDAGRWRGELTRFVPRILGPVYVQVAPGGQTAYLGSSSPFNDALWGTAIQLDPVPTNGLMAGRIGHPRGVSVRGEFFLSPDGEVIITRVGQLYRLREVPGDYNPAPRQGRLSGASAV
jgi:hypothetical protein